MGPEHVVAPDGIDPLYLKYTGLDATRTLGIQTPPRGHYAVPRRPGNPCSSTSLGKTQPRATNGRNLVLVGKPSDQFHAQRPRQESREKTLHIGSRQIEVNRNEIDLVGLTPPDKTGNSG